MNNIADRVKDIISELSGIDKKAIKKNHFLCSLGLDSLMRAEVFSVVYEEFGVELYNESGNDYGAFITVGDIIEFVKSKTKSN